jgi:hypothetical protein
MIHPNPPTVIKPHFTVLISLIGSHQTSTRLSAKVAKEPMNSTDWQAVAAKAQAFQALHLADLGDKSLAERARFLIEALGLSRADAAALLRSSDESLRVTFAREAKKGAAAEKLTADNT